MEQKRREEVIIGYRRTEDKGTMIVIAPGDTRSQVASGYVVYTRREEKRREEKRREEKRREEKKRL